MICGSEHFYQESLKENCRMCGSKSGVPCKGEEFTERFVHMQRVKQIGGRASHHNDPMRHKGKSGRKF